MKMGDVRVKEKEILEVLGFHIDNKGNWGNMWKIQPKKLEKGLEQSKESNSI